MLESEDHIQILMRLGVGVLIFDQKGVVLAANREAAKILRSSEEELLHRSVDLAGRVVKSDGSPLRPEEFPVLRALRSGEAVAAEIVGFDLEGSGERIWVSTSAVPIFVEATRRRLIACTLADVRETRTALGEGLALYDSVIRAMSEGVAIHDPNVSIRSANPAAEKILGLTLSQLTGRSPSENSWTLVDANGAPLTEEAIPSEITRKTGEPCSDVRVRVHRSDGTTVWVSVSTDPYRPKTAEEGAGVVATFTDITRETQALFELKRSREQLERVLDAVPGVVYQYFVGSDGAQSYPFISSRVFEICGITAEEVQAAPEASWLNVHEEDRDELRAQTTASFRTLSRLQADFRYYRKDGVIRHGRIVAVPELSDGGVLATGMMFDVTDARHLEQALQVTRRREAMGDLAAGIAHNFNNMLAAILPNVEMAIHGARPESVELLEDALLAAKSAAELVKQMLALGKPEQMRAGGIADFRILAENATRICRATFDRGIAFDIDLAQGPFPVKGHAGNLEQVVLNLLLNARDAVRGRSSPMIKVRLCRIGDMARLSVEDNGVGMSEETRARIGEPFFTTKPVGAGTGLGLASTFHTALDCGGRWTVDSTVEVGSTFIIDLPLEGRLPPMPDSSSDPNVVPALGLIVVVDDDDLVRRVIVRQLIRAGYTVREASNGEEALAVLDALSEEERGLLRAALLDLSMPGLSGKQLLDEVNRKYENLPVVILSGHIEDESLLSGARAVLQKPILSAELLRVVREVTA